MGALTGSISLRRYRVLGTPPKDWKDSYAKSVRAHALVPLDPAGREEKSVGWCSLHDENDLDLPIEKFHLEGRILLSMRIDSLKVPAGHVKRVLKQRQREIEAERAEPLSAGALRDLKAILVAELRQKTPPRTKTVDMVWDLDKGRIYFYAHSKGMNEAFLTLFAQTFNVPLDLEGPSAWARDFVGEDEALAARLKDAKPTVELLQGFVGLRPGPRVLDELEELVALASGKEASL
ncbi:MAG: recombination-associated protein RdgC [Polyangia bacterium]